ncbi:MAG: UbiA family prenyltransferase [DPANN group archaeon]|nr:UbiA family prenyltransferase [DPANN group archaeon]
MNAYLEILRPVNGLLAGFGVIISMFIGLNGIIYSPLLFFAFIAIFFITSAGNVANDYFDCEVDRVNKKYRPIPSGRITLKNALIYMYALFAIGIIASAFINMYTLIFAIFSSLVLYEYNTIKRNSPYGGIVIGILVASLFIFGGLAVGNVISLVFMGFLAGLCNIAREITKDIEDIEGDRGRKQTLPLIYGAKATSYLASFLLFVCIGLSLHPLITSMFGQYYFITIYIADTILLYSAARLIYNPTKYASDVHQLEKIGMSMALLAFFVGII